MLEKKPKAKSDSEITNRLREMTPIAVRTEAQTTAFEVARLTARNGRTMYEQLKREGVLA